MKNPVRQIKSYSPVVKKRSLEDALRQISERSERIAELTRQVIELGTRNEEWAREVRSARLELQRNKEYPLWLEENYPKNDDLANQKRNSIKFNYRPLISVIMPVYNTSPNYLRASIESVLEQSYEHWQLCIVDDASTNHETIDCLREYIKCDSRIIIKRSKQNGHISTASNKAIEIADGEFIALLDHDDFLWPNALYEVVNLLQDNRNADFVYSDEDKIGAKTKEHFWPYFKPDWSPHLLECINYITHFSVLRTSIVRDLGGFNKDLVGAQDWDLFLRVTEKTQNVLHVPTVLYSWRAHEGSTAYSMDSKNYAKANQHKAIVNHFSRISKRPVKVVPGAHESMWLAKYSLHDTPLVSILIPTKDKSDYLRRCIDSIIEKTLYSSYEIIIIDTGSTEEATNSYYESLKQTFSSTKLRVKHCPTRPFNYSDANNFGFKYAKGEYLVFLNNDTELITGSWLEDMLGYAQLPNVGAVGVKLLYPNKQIQHAGVALGIGGSTPGRGGGPVAGHPGINMDYVSKDFFQALYTNTIRDVSAVTAACLMISRKLFKEIGGFDSKFRVTFNDVDFCLKLRDKHYQNIYLPFVELYHHESVSVGKISHSKRDTEELGLSGRLMREKWEKYIQRDEFYNPNFNKLSPTFGLAINENGPK